MISYFLRLHDDDYGAAPVGFKECTKDPKPYHDLNYPGVKFWDLPGIGTPSYPNLETYRQKVELDKYQTFLVFASGRFTANDKMLVNYIRKQGKSFLFIRTKIDENVRAEKRKKSFSEAAMLQKIRDNCKVNLVDDDGNPISSDDDIFLISNHYPEKWDFSRLAQAILDALPRYQRQALTLSLSNLTSMSKDILKRKVDVLKGRMVLVAGLSAVVAAVPIPELAIVVDAVLIFNEVQKYITQLGIPVEGSGIFNVLSPVTQQEIVAVRLQFSSMAGFRLLFANQVTKSAAVEEIARFTPVVGSVIAGSVSFGCTIVFLRGCLEKIEKLALAVVEEANQRSVDSLDRE